MTKRVWRGSAMVAATAVCGAALVACGSSSNSASSTAAPGSGGGTPAASGGTIKVGLLAEESGELSAFGPAIVAGVKLAVQQANADPSNRYKISLTVMDDRSETSTAVADATQLIRNDHVAAIIGPLANMAPPVVKLGASSHVINVNAATSISALGGTPSYPLLFVSEPTLAQFAATPAAAIAKLLPSAHTVAVVGPNDTDGQGTAPLIMNALKSHGLAGQEYLYPEGTSNLTGIMAKVQSKTPDVVMPGWSVSDWTPALAALTPAGIPKTTPIFIWASTVAQAKSPGVDGRPVFVDPQVTADFTSPAASQTAKKFETQLQAASGGKLPPNPTNAELYYPDVLLLAKAASQAGTPSDSQKIAAAMKDVSVTALGAPMRYDRTNHILAPQSVTYINHGQYKTITVP